MRRALATGLAALALATLSACSTAAETNPDLEQAVQRVNVEVFAGTATEADVLRLIDAMCETMGTAYLNGRTYGDTMESIIANSAGSMTQDDVTVISRAALKGKCPRYWTWALKDA